jgi:hypothetical protein
METIKFIACFFLIAVFIYAGASSLQAQTESRYRSQHLKYVDEARTQAIAGTLVPLALGIGTASLVENNTVKKTASFAAVYGLVLGPSLGNFYAKDYARGMLGIAARMGGGYLLLDATRELAGKDVADGLGWDDKSVSLTDTRVLIGGGIIIASAVYNVISAKASVESYNRNTGYTIGLAPVIVNDQTVPLVTANIQF